MDEDEWVEEVEVEEDVDGTCSLVLSCGINNNDIQAHIKPNIHVRTLPKYDVRKGKQIVVPAILTVFTELIAPQTEVEVWDSILSIDLA